MAERFVTVDALQRFCRDEVTTDRDDLLQAIYSAESQLDSLDGTARRIAPADAVATARVFTPSYCSDLLWFDDAADVTAISENGVTLTVNVDYRLLPLNGLDPVTGDYRPWYCARRLGAAGVGYRDWYRQDESTLITVTATWGWTTIPPLAILAVKILAKNDLLSRNVSHGLVGIAETGGVGERESKQVLDAFRALHHPNKWGIAGGGDQ
jgi:hypothetical protein